MSKRILLWICKACLSGIIAFTILTGVCMLYYNVPVHYSVADGSTDYSWEANKFYSRGTEGFACGKTNNEGYLNPFDYSKSISIDTLIMGSSHMEAYQIAQNKSTAGVLRALMPDKTIYNIGVSGHDFLVCADNLFAAVNKYKPKQFVIMETSKLDFSDIQLEDAIHENIADLQSSTRGLVETLQKNPFLRLLYTQFKNFLDKNADKDVPPINAEKTIGSEVNYNALLAKLSKTVRDNGSQLIIVYHPSLVLNEDATASSTADKELSDFFALCCEKNGIIFLDMSNRFLEGYKKESVLPHGFINTSIGKGHLNENGHAMIAESIYEIMKEFE